MKKIIVILLSAFLLLNVVSCERKETADTPADDIITGAWAASNDTALTEEVKAVFEKGLEDLVGVNYVPVACLGTQVVAGTNYCVLARATVVYPDAKPYYTFVFLYEDLSGAVSLMNIANVGPEVASEDLTGGWSGTYDISIPEELRAALEAEDAAYIPVAHLYTQLVAGTNHCVLVKKGTGYALITLYRDLDDKVAVTETEALDVWSLCEYGVG